MKRSGIYSIRIIVFVYLFFFISCDQKKNPNSYTKLSGRTMGTSYSIIFKDFGKVTPQGKIDSILISINQSVSTYIPSSTISQLNTDSLGLLSDSSRVIYQLPLDKHFIANFTASKQVYKETQGLFDPSVAPLVNYWGFGYTGKNPVTQIDSQEVQRLKNSVGFDMWTLSLTENDMHISKPMNSKIDFSAIAKGYAVDFLSKYLEKAQIQNYMVEIGGEVRTKGVNPQNKSWSIGLSKPDPKAKPTDWIHIKSISNLSMASSGNYRNFYEVEQRSYGHEINPITGFPQMSKILGVSVTDTSCMLADAYATACMIMELNQAVDFINQLPHTDAVLYFSEKDTIFSKTTTNWTFGQPD